MKKRIGGNCQLKPCMEKCKYEPDDLEEPGETGEADE
jgi:hypothetical protein